MMKRILSFVSALCVMVCFCFSSAAAFSDVDENSWASDAIQRFAQKGIVNGMEDGSFQPQASVTREQFAKMLVLSFKMSILQNVKSSFDDVADKSWSCPYIETGKNYLTGFGSLFMPRTPATREQVAAALVRAMGVKVSNSGEAKNKFSDSADISPELVPFVDAAVENLIVNGYDDGAFRPKAQITRAEAVVMLSRAIKDELEEQPQKPADTAPAIKITSCPSSVDTDSINVTGIVSGTTPVVTVNGNEVALDDNGKFSATVALKEGKNEIKIIAENKIGRDEKVRTVTYTPKITGSLQDENEYWGVLTHDAFRVNTGNRKGMEFTVWNGVEEKTMVIETDEDLSSEMLKGTVAEIVQKSNGSVEVKRRAGRYGSITGADGNNIQIIDSETQGGSVFRVTSDTAILYTDSDGNGTSGSGINYRVGMDNDGNYPTNVYYVGNGGDKLKCIVIGIDNGWGF